MLCIEQNEEWLVGRAYLSAESMSLVLAEPDDHPPTAYERAAFEQQLSELARSFASTYQRADRPDELGS